MTLVLDTGALIAFDRGDADVAATVELARRAREQLVTSSGCVAQAWRGGGPRQARLARLLDSTKECGLDADASRHIGALCAVAHASDVVDAHVAFLADHGDVVVTSDRDDLERLLGAAQTRANVQAC